MLHAPEKGCQLMRDVLYQTGGAIVAHKLLISRVIVCVTVCASVCVRAFVRFDYDLGGMMG